MKKKNDYCYQTTSNGLSRKNVSMVVDCPVTGVDVNSIRDIYRFIEETIPLVFSNIRYEIVFESNEPIGSTHTLHRFRIPINENYYIGVRVVVRGRSLKRILFTIPSGVNIKVTNPKQYRYDPGGDVETNYTSGIRDTGIPGQVYIDIPIVYAILGVPSINVSEWILKIEGMVEKPIELSLNDLYELGIEEIETDFHCVTGWSVRNMVFAGIPLRKIIELVKPYTSVKWLYANSLDGYSTIFPFSEALEPKSIIAIEMNNKPLDILHGYPARLIIPHLYGWKSIKWLNRIVFLEEYRDGYWEALGYHPRGRVVLEERFKSM